MAYGDNSSNTAIVALIVVGLAVAAGVFIYFQGGFGQTDTVRNETTIIERQVPVPAPVPEVKQEDEPGFKLEHEDDEGNKTEIQSP